MNPRAALSRALDGAALVAIGAGVVVAGRVLALALVGWCS